MVDGAGDNDREESLAREADLCLTGESSLSYGTDLGLADSTLIGLHAPLCAAAASSRSSCSENASASPSCWPGCKRLWFDVQNFSSLTAHTRLHERLHLRLFG